MTEKTFTSVGVISKHHKGEVTDTVKTLVDYLKSRNVIVVVENKTADLLPNFSGKTVKINNLGNACELVIVVGGDGSLLHAAHHVAQYNTPLLGINRGYLGFLTDVNPKNMSTELDHILAGRYFIENRFCLEATVQYNMKTIGHGWALNEVAILPGPMPHIAEFEIYIDEQFVCNQRSDGLIIATPTGSTAYSLSAGGPILHPELNSMVIVPMFPHSLNSRPLVIDGEHKILINVTKNNQTVPRVACDSQHYIDAKPGSVIMVHKMQQQVRLVHPLNYDYFGALRSKLHWGKKNFNESPC